MVNILTVHVSVHPAPSGILLDSRHDMKLTLTYSLCKR